MVARVLAEVRLDAAVCRERFIFQLLVVDELGFIHQKPRQGQRVRAARSVLGDDNGARAIMERYDMLIIVRLDNGSGKRLRGLSADNVVEAVEIAPTLPSGEQPRQGVGQAVFEGGHHNPPSRAGHTLHIAQHKRSSD